MCCFIAPTQVSGTKIFARSRSKGRQVLVYSMRYAAERATAMILPLPIALGTDGAAAESAVRFQSLLNYPTFFEALDHAFPAMELGIESSKAAPMPGALAVHQVGDDYVASFVPNIDAFSRLDPSFTISKSVWAQIPSYADYGFAVFQLKEPKGSPHPMAFEFDTLMEASLFFPTVHIHDGTVHKTETFDHMLCAQDVAFDTAMARYKGPESIDRATGLVRSEGPASNTVDLRMAQGLVDGNLHLHRMVVKGTHANEDIVL